MQIDSDLERTETEFWGGASHLNDHICISMASHFIYCLGHPLSLDGSRHNGKMGEILVIGLFFLISTIVSQCLSHPDFTERGREKRGGKRDEKKVKKKQTM